MMYTAEVNNINELLHNVCNAILQMGRQVTVREMKTWELHPAVIEIEYPTDRTLLYPHRGNNPFATLYETIWVLGSPDNSIETLKKFIPRASDYSDDGKVWRAGYPDRLRRAGSKKVDQIDYVFKKLKDDPTTRQAVITLWNPDLDDFKENGELMVSQDFPCSNYLHFMIRDDRLDCTFVIRSNDCIYGMTGINVYEFTVIQEILATLLKRWGVSMGKFYYIADSLHLYEEHKEKALLLAKYDPFDWQLPKFAFGEELYFWKEYQEKMARACMCIDKGVVPINNSDGKKFGDMVRLCQIFLMYKDRPKEAFKDFCEEMGQIEFTDLHCSCMFWFMKHWKLVSDVTRITEAIEMSNVHSRHSI